MTLELYRRIKNSNETLKLTEGETNELIRDLVDEGETGYKMPNSTRSQLLRICHKATIFYGGDEKSISLICKGGALSHIAVKHLNNAFKGYI